MVPQGFAAPNAALNSTIHRANALVKKLATLGIIVTGLEINPVGGASPMPVGNVGAAQAQALGVGPDDLVHLLFTYVGNQGNQSEVAVIEQLLAQATISAIIAIFNSLFPGLNAAQSESRALTALANIPSVATAVQTALA